MATSGARDQWTWSIPTDEDALGTDDARAALSLAPVANPGASGTIDVELPGWAPEGYVYVWPEEPRRGALLTVAKLVLTFAVAAAVLGVALIVVAKLLIATFESVFPNAV